MLGSVPILPSRAFNYIESHEISSVRFALVFVSQIRFVPANSLEWLLMPRFRLRLPIALRLELAGGNVKEGARE